MCFSKVNQASIPFVVNQAVVHAKKGAHFVLSLNLISTSQTEIPESSVLWQIVKVNAFELAAEEKSQQGMRMDNGG